MTDSISQSVFHTLIDLAGVDGLQVMRTLLGDPIDRLAPFQSLEVELVGVPCGVLRLCEGNFRLACAADGAPIEALLQEAIAGQRAWIKRFPWLGAIVLAGGIEHTPLPTLAIAKPPHRLQGLAVNCALPARVDGTSILIWQRSPGGHPTTELHLATQAMERLKQHILSSPHL